MPNTLSKTEICNLALDHLDEATITDFDTDTSARARLLRRNFWPVAWALMRKHPWNFVSRRIQIASSAATPAFGWSYSYDLPDHCLRVLPLTDDGTENGNPVPYKVEGTQILTNWPPPLNVRYLYKIDDTNGGGTGAFDQQFVDLLAAAIAQKIAHFITGKQSYAQALGQMAQGLLLEAQMIDSLEGTPDDPVDDFWIDARQ